MDAQPPRLSDIEEEDSGQGRASDGWKGFAAMALFILVAVTVVVGVVGAVWKSGSMGNNEVGTSRGNSKAAGGGGGGGSVVRMKSYNSQTGEFESELVSRDQIVIIMQDS